MKGSRECKLNAWARNDYVKWWNVEEFITRYLKIYLMFQKFHHFDNRSLSIIFTHSLTFLDFLKPNILSEDQRNWLMMSNLFCKQGYFCVLFTHFLQIFLPQWKLPRSLSNLVIFKKFSKVEMCMLYLWIVMDFVKLGARLIPPTCPAGTKCALNTTYRGLW